MAEDPGIQVNRKDLSKTFMMNANWKKTFDLHGFYKNMLALQGLLSISPTEYILFEGQVKRLKIAIDVITS